MYLFADSYSQGRQNFLSACEQAGLEVDSHINPNAVAPGGADLAMDVAWCGPVSASRVFLVSSGTHGLEAASGSATMLQWLHDKKSHNLPPDTALLFVHSVNAYGWAYSSRTNEDNIDLNRNFLDHDAEHPQNPAYEKLHKLLLSNDVSAAGLEESLRRYHDFAAQNGENTAIHGITGGQYSLPDGISYGGTQPCWSYQTLKGLVGHYLPNARKVVCIDWHTGIGSFGEPFIIISDTPGGEHYQRACAYWGEQYVHSDNIFDSAGRPDYSGLMIDWLRDEIRSVSGAEVLAVVIEFGTYPVESMLEALLMDRWLRVVDTHPASRFSIETSTRLVERFYPSIREWRHSVLAHSERIYAQAIKGLNAW